jgi:transposase
MKNTIEVPFDIENVEILNTEINEEGQLIITVRNTDESVCCHSCGKDATELYGHADVRQVRHTSCFGLETYIRFYPKRYECLHCGKTITQQLSGCEPYCHHTIAYENHVLLQLVNSTVSDIAIKENLTVDEAQGIIDRYIEKEVNWDSIETIALLGLDEISRKKGHKDFVTIVTTRVNDKIIILAILKDRKKDTVKKFLKSIPKRLRKTIKAVCSDMYEGFINAVKEVLKVKVVVDRFHVAKLYRKSLDSLRKSEMKRIKEELSLDEYKELKNVMWILRKNPSDLDFEEKMTLILLFNHSPMLELAYRLSNELTGIFNQKISKSEAKKKIRAWKRRVAKSELTCFDSFLSTLTSRENEILNYFDDRFTSGFVEGLNNKLKVIKRRCYGILNIGHWFQRIYLDLEGYSLFV